MREIEQKHPLENPDTVRKNLLALGAKIEPRSNQEDIYFSPKDRSFLEPDIISEWLRLRQDDRGASITYKCWQPIGEEIQTHCDEFETSVGDIGSIEKILKSLNLEEIVRVSKIREEFILREFTIAIDTVKNLGTFLEIEISSESDDFDALHKSISDLRQKLCAVVGEQDRRGYPYQLLKRAR